MHRQSETRAGNHRRHTRTRNASLPTQANHTARGARKQPPNWALHMQLAKIPHTHQTTPPATRAASADQHGTHRGRNRYHPSTKHLYLCAAQEVCCAAHSTVCTSPPATRYDVLLAIDINMACPPTHVDRRAPPRPRIIREDEQAQRGYAGLEARAKNIRFFFRVIHFSSNLLTQFHAAHAASGPPPENATHAEPGSGGGAGGARSTSHCGLNRDHRCTGVVAVEICCIRRTHTYRQEHNQ